MKVITKIVMNITTGEVLEEESYEYDGPVALCKGGSQTTQTQDPVYNARMANIAEEQQGQATEMYNVFKYGVPYDPYTDSGRLYKTGKKVPNPEHDQWVEKKAEYDNAVRNSRFRNYARGGDSDSSSFNSQPALPPSPGPEPDRFIDETKSKTNSEVFGYDPNNTISEMQLMQKQIEAEYNLLPQQTAAEGAGLDLQRMAAEDAQKTLQERSPVISKFYEEAYKGVNVDERVAQARSGVMQDFEKSADITNRNLSRLGISPDSGRGRDMFAKTGVEQAKALAGASTAAKTQAEEENFNRLKTGAGLGIQYS